SHPERSEGSACRTLKTDLCCARDDKGVDMEEVVIVSAVRSAVGRGKKDGSLANVHAVDLSAALMNGVVKRTGIDPAIIDDGYWGCAMPEATQGLNVARLAWLRAGLP